jgi:hypothetical protein
MKNLIFFLFVICICCVSCTGTINQSPDQLIDVAFVGMIVAKPEIKPVVVKGIDKILVVLEKDITYDELLATISAQFKNQYAPVAVLIIDFLNQDKPISTEWLTLFDTTRTTIKTKLTHLRMLASI